MSALELPLGQNWGPPETPSALHSSDPPPALHGAQFCNWTLPYGQCTTSERYPGLWEVPLLDFQTAAGDSLSTMDPTAASADALYQQMVENFKFSYNGGWRPARRRVRQAAGDKARTCSRWAKSASRALRPCARQAQLMSQCTPRPGPLPAGNRAPMGIYVHAPWFTADHTAALKTFMTYALALPDVWFVTARCGEGQVEALCRPTAPAGFEPCALCPAGKPWST